MTISIWRLSHLMLAVVSSVFIALASITGLILAFEPISNQAKSYQIDGDTSLATSIESLSKRYDEILSISTDENDFVIASVITTNGESDTFYVNPRTGEKLGPIIEKAAIFKFSTNLHRSLFLKSTGRFMVGIVSFFLILIALTGVVLIARRQGGISRFFSRVIHENFEQYYHVSLGRWLLIPILIVALTGVYLSLEKFSLLPETKVVHTYPETGSESTSKIAFEDFEAFKTIRISEIKSVEFPFSDDAEDYFFIQLKDKELLVNQVSGAIASEQHYPSTQLLAQTSLWLHTGQGTVLWSIVLALVSLGLLFFIYSGFAMTLKRLRQTKKTKNKYHKDEADFIVLVGSETGSTFTFANLFFEALLAKKQKVYITEMNGYSTFKKAKELIIFTSTYGEGEAPVNANKFEALINDISQTNKTNYSVVGFGSLLYKDYCKYADDVDLLLDSHQNFIQKLPVFKINNQSFEAFQNWLSLWNASSNFGLSLSQPELKRNTKFTQKFTVVKRSELNSDQTFVLQLKPNKKIKFQSGDLLAIRPDKDEAARQYSIAKIDGNVLLSIKKHDKGVCSSYLSQLNLHDSISATLEPNPEFWVPKSAKDLVLIANGTGIAPFLGMIQANTKGKHVQLFWGGRKKSSFNLYSELLNLSLKQKKLTKLHLTCSQEQDEKIYIQDLVAHHANFMAKHLQNEGIIMICGSIAMQKAVVSLLDTITTEHLKLPLTYFENRDQLRMDCY